MLQHIDKIIYLVVIEYFVFYLPDTFKLLIFAEIPRKLPKFPQINKFFVDLKGDEIR